MTGKTTGMLLIGVALIIGFLLLGGPQIGHAQSESTMTTVEFLLLDHRRELEQVKWEIEDFIRHHGKGPGVEVKNVSFLTLGQQTYCVVVLDGPPRPR